MNRHIWTDNEIQILKENYPQFGSKKCSQLLKVGKRVIEKKVYALGLSRSHFMKTNVVLYMCWANMLKNGAVCAAWRKNYWTFYEWAMDNEWNNELMIRRINFKKPYGPKNCIFTTITDNNRHKTNVKLDFEDVKVIRLMVSLGIPRSEIAEQFGISVSNISTIYLGKSWV